MIRFHRKYLSGIGAMMVISVLAGCSTLAATKREPDPWAGMKQRTAWIILGYVETASGTWATLPAYHIERRNIIGDARMPGIGDVLSITHDRPLYILGFKHSGVTRQMESPAGVDLQDSDLTGAVLKPGTRVVVKEVRRDSGSACDSLCTVWARVVPAAVK